VSVIEKAKELGYALRETEEATILQAAEVNLDNDKESRNLISEFQQSFTKIQKAKSEGKEVSQEELDAFNNLQEKMKENKTIQAYFAAQKGFQVLLQQVNAVINMSLQGSCSSSDCSGGCSGCM
jgi:cell fate (sporulation/competence/biofilm development) regulator YlbF (YheA/YmcA/DUF963 family)